MANTDKGFYDPNGVYPKYKDEVDTNRLAVNLKEDAEETNPHLSLTLRRSTRITGVATADFNPVTAADGSSIAASDGDTFDQPEIPYATLYPYNRVFESESGHIMEYDDTPSNERIHQRHKTGTSYEIHPNGSKVTRIKKDNYTIVTNDEYCHIQGIARQTVDEGLRIRVNAKGEIGNNYNIEVGNLSLIHI
mgnify:CR=1 FL=1